MNFRYGFMGILHLLMLMSLIGCSMFASQEENKLKDVGKEGDELLAASYQYQVRGKRYKVFKSANAFQEIGMASWYGPGFNGRRTANGEIYNMYAMTAAHKTLPLGTKVQVTNLSTGKKVIVRINDRGPFHGGRIIDLSKKAAQKLGVIKQGSVRVHIKIAK
ncbi:MAG: septal ring lytic transglycosylase RlpA family protein [Ostreibacterium sp.]